MIPLQETAGRLNTIGDYLAKRDIPSLTTAALREKFQIERGDWLIVFGGIIPFGCDLAAQAFLGGIAERLMIVGGEGHTTDVLRRNFNERHPEIETHGRKEAQIIADYFRRQYGIKNCLLETQSTHCGNNVSLALEVLKAEGALPRHAILMQDSTMQRRMDATFRKIWSQEATLAIHYAPYRARVVVEDGHLAFAEKNLWGMWDMNHYISLLMGEIARLSDTPEGYGPQGKNFIAHGEVPPEVRSAFEELQRIDGFSVREALPA